MAALLAMLRASNEMGEEHVFLQGVRVSGGQAIPGRRGGCRGARAAHAHERLQPSRDEQRALIGRSAAHACSIRPEVQPPLAPVEEEWAAEQDRGSAPPPPEQGVANPAVRSAYVFFS